MTTSAYDEVLTKAQQLDPTEQLRLVEELASLVRQRFPRPRQRSILELEGLGKGIWEGIDVDAYINEERNSWSG
jgi:hypothetical protein